MKFECQPNCGKCCKGSGVLFLTDRDIAMLAFRLRLAASDFRQKYVHLDSAGRQILYKGDYCPFLSRDNKCAVHGAHPTQCRTFPFWTGNLKIWDSLAEKCPGMHVGPEIPETEMLESFEESSKVLPGFDLKAHF